MGKPCSFYHNIGRPCSLSCIALIVPFKWGLSGWVTNSIKALLDSGHVVPSSSLYGYPILSMEKKGWGGLRICINYRTLNLDNFNDPWLLPYIDNLLACFHGCKFFLKLNLCDGYHQIPTHPSDYFEMAFCCCCYNSCLQYLPRITHQQQIQMWLPS